MMFIDMAKKYELLSAGNVWIVSSDVLSNLTYIHSIQGKCFIKVLGVSINYRSIHIIIFLI